MAKIVGFDIGENSVKMVYFSGSDLKKAVAVDLPDDMVSGERILSMDAMADFIRSMAKANGIPLTNAAYVLGADNCFTRMVTVPLMSEQQLIYNLPYEFHDFLTEEKKNYFFDYSMQDIINDEDGNPDKMELFACAMLKTSVEDYRAMFRRSGFKLKLLTPSESAFSVLLKRFAVKFDRAETDRCVLNLGHHGTDLYIFQGSKFDSRRGFETGGKDLDKLIADHYGVDIHVAHSYKQSNYEDVLNADYTIELYNRIASDVVRAVNFYNYNNRERELRDIYLCGGGAAVEPLKNAIGELTRLNVHSADDLLPQKCRVKNSGLYLRAIAGVFESFGGTKE